MDWSTEKWIKRTLQNEEGYEPDPEFASSLRQMCLQSLKTKEKRARRVAHLSRVAAVMSVTLVLFMGSAFLISHQNHHAKTPVKPSNPLLATARPETPVPQHRLSPETKEQEIPETNLQSKATSDHNKNITETAAGADQPRGIKGEKEARQFLTQVVGERYSREYQALQRIEKEEGKAEITFTRGKETASDPGSVISVSLDSADRAVGIVVTDSSSADIARIVEFHGLKSPAWIEDMLASRLQLFYRVSTATLIYEMPELEEIDAHSGRFFGKADYLSAQYQHSFIQEVQSQGQSFSGNHVKELADLLTEDTGIEVENLPVHEKKGEKSSTIIWQNEQGKRLTLETNSEGNIIGFAYQESDQHQAERKIQLSELNAREIAARFLSKHMPKSISHVYFYQASRQGNGSVIQMEWMPVIDQIPIRDRSFLITIDLSDGKIIAFRGDFTDIPDKINTRQKPMERAECIASFLKQYPLQLRGTPSIHPLQGDPSFHYRLIGLPPNAVEFNAYTGKCLD
ncbi:YcdB/YcdC domain-containing protein [Brevibacillus sp. GCM10020057]|uniref:YcdB/YcdC domain-containing protein n=1 Tax=Brevibacillus sp. GCM10020057 TaxID=3317327 RepID=UPI0036417AAA